MYLRARWYQPGTGQLLGVDPLLAQTGTPYSYANDNPVNGSDPSGQCTLGKVDFLGLESGSGDCNHYIDQQLHQQGVTSPLIQQDEAAVNAAIDQVLGDVHASQDQAAVMAALNSPAGYSEYEVLDGGQLSADQQQQLGQTDLQDLAAFQAELNGPGPVAQAAVDAPTKGKAGFFLGLCLGAFNLAKKVNPQVAVGFLVVAGVIIIAVRVYSHYQPKPQPTP